MPKTPPQTETHRYNPYITKSISKSLLTPCRRVGLSRKRKTPTISKDSFSENKSDITSNSSSFETPVSSNLLNGKESSTAEKLLVESRDSGIHIKDRKKTKVSKRLAVEDEKQAKTEIAARDGEDTLKTDPLLNDGSSESKSLQQLKTKTECKAPITIVDSTDLSKGVEDKENTSLVQDLNKKSQGNKTKLIAKKPKDKKKISLSRYLKIIDSDDEEDKPLEAEQPKDKKKPGVSRCVNIIDSDVEFTKPLKESHELKENQQKERINLKLEEQENLSIAAEDEFFKEASKPKQYGVKRSIKKHNSNADSQENEILKPESKFSQQLKEPEEKADIRECKPENVKHKDETKTTQLPRMNSQQEIVKNSPKTKQSLGMLFENLDDRRVVRQKTNKIRRSLSLKKTTSDEEIKKVNSKECFISLNCMENFDSITNSDIESLENQICEKKKILDELKQAEIYRKKLDIKELKGLTALWKAGCISALNDLLPVLQEHGNIDMAKLLNNLNIPKDKINLTPSGDLI